MQNRIKEVMELFDKAISSARKNAYYGAKREDESASRAAYEFISEYKAIESKLHELLTPVELSDEDIKNLDDNTHFHESPDWSVRFARNVLKAAGVN